MPTTPSKQHMLPALTARSPSPPCTRILQDNQLTGGLPPQWGGWGEEGLPALRVLNLSNNPIGAPAAACRFAVERSMHVGMRLCDPGHLLGSAAWQAVP